jgi:DNA polymerase I-like protein with 3'-5' exonuclease and polymerase domains
MVRTGRTSCSKPNIQQVPRKGGFRESFRPSPGHFFLAVDYSFIELVTLAAVCETRYGKSVLADVIRAGRDPHAYTAAILLGMAPDDFLALRESDPKKFKEWRQMAKPLNFGIPGGLGAASLVTYARRAYSVVMTIEEAREFRQRMIGEVYPEWADYLTEDSMAVLAASLECTVNECWAALDWKGDRSPGLVWAIRRVVRGELNRKDGLPYNPRFITGVWSGLNRINRSPALALLLTSCKGSDELCRRLFDSGVVTMTGRIRGRVSYTQCRNTPFQGLAADGAKLALWRLLREGYRVVGFIHDEILIELPDEGGYISKKIVDRITEIMCSEMELVLGGTLPVGCEAVLSTCWSKEAKLIERDGRIYPWSPGCSTR